MPIGNLIRSIRINKGISQAEACSNVVTQSNYSKFELGKIDVSSTALIKIINNLDISLDEFFFLYDQEHEDILNLLINKFFTIPLNNPNELQAFRNNAINFMKKNEINNNTLQNIIQLSFGLEEISITEDYEKASKYAAPIWNSLQKRDRWYLREIIILNVILYIFPIETAEEIVKRSVRFLNEYKEHKSQILVKLNLYINLALLHIKNTNFNEAIHYLNLAINTCPDHSYEFYKKLSQMRLAYCKANINEPFEEDFISIVMYFTSTNSLAIFEHLKKESEKYCINTEFLHKMEQYEQKIKALL